MSRVSRQNVSFRSRATRIFPLFSSLMIVRLHRSRPDPDKPSKKGSEGDVLGRLRPAHRYDRHPLRPLRDLPVAEIPALVADDQTSFEGQPHRGRPTQHPTCQRFDGEAPTPPAYGTAVQDRPDRLETEGLFELEPLGERPVQILRLTRLALELGVEPGEIGLQETVRFFQGRNRRQPVLESGEGPLDPTLGLQ